MSDATMIWYCWCCSITQSQLNSVNCSRKRPPPLLPPTPPTFPHSCSDSHEWNNCHVTLHIYPSQFVSVYLSKETQSRLLIHFQETPSSVALLTWDGREGKKERITEQFFRIILKRKSLLSNMLQEKERKKRQRFLKPFSSSLFC